MIFGIAVTAGVVGSMLDPYSSVRLMQIVAVVTGGAFLMTCAAVAGIERRVIAVEREPDPTPFFEGLKEVWAERRARNFTIFVFLSMTAYFMQELILEPYAGLVFAFTPGQSTSLSGAQNGGVFVGMLLLGMADLLLTNLGFHMSITMHVWLSSLLGTMSVSLLCGAAQQEFFKDRELLMVGIRAGGVASGIITVLGVPFLLLGNEFASGLVLVGLLALLVWHMFVGVRLMSRARVVRARTLGKARRCVKCLYDIRDVVGGKCPECGEPLRNYGPVSDD